MRSNLSLRQRLIIGSASVGILSALAAALGPAQGPFARVAVCVATAGGLAAGVLWFWHALRQAASSCPLPERW